MVPIPPLPKHDLLLPVRFAHANSQQTVAGALRHGPRDVNPAKLNMYERRSCCQRIALTFPCPLAMMSNPVKENDDVRTG